MTTETVVVTGANSGLGRQIAHNLAAGGKRVILACRAKDRADEARATLAVETGNSNIEVALVDLASQASIRRFAAELAERTQSIDVLVNNAGVQLEDRSVTDDGVERVFATNVVGPHLLTKLMLPLLVAAPAGRIVNMASSFAGEVDLNDLQFERRTYNRTAAYKQSKACNRLLTWELARRLESTRIVANAVSPGMVRTNLYRGLGMGMRAVMRGLQAAFGVSVEVGADTASWLASAPADDLGGMSGELVEKRVPIECKFRDASTERAVWEYCELLSGQAAPVVGSATVDYTPRV